MVCAEDVAMIEVRRQTSMYKVPNKSNMTLISVVLGLILLYVSAAQAQRNEKLGAFVAQYKALRQEGLNLWRSVQTADMAQEARLLSLQGEILNYRKRLNSLAVGIEEYNLQRQREQRKFDPDDQHMYLVVARAADALANVLTFAFDYLSIKKAVYLRVALKYEEGWRALDELVKE
jgi:hypothetical protein